MRLEFNLYLLVAQIFAFHLKPCQRIELKSFSLEVMCLIFPFRFRRRRMLTFTSASFLLFMSTLTNIVACTVSYCCVRVRMKENTNLI